MDIIIGAGVSGISYALFSDNDSLIIEKENEIGGYCRTIKRNGFTWDYSGHFFHFRNNNIKDLVTKHLNKQDLQQVTKSTKIYYAGELIDFPFQKNIHQLPKSEFIECLYDLFAASGVEGATSFKKLLYGEFGAGISKKFLVPYNEKLYACDLDKLDSNAMGRFFPHANKEEIVLNFKQRKNGSYNESFIYPKGGAIEYIKSLAHDIPNSIICTNTSVISINPLESTVTLSDGRCLDYDNLISTIPLPKLLELCDIQYDENVFSWNQVLVFNLGFNKQGLNTKDHWLYFPDKNLSFYRVGFYSNILCENRLSLYVELGFDKNAKVNPNEWLGKVLHDLKDCKIINDDFYLIDYESILMNPAYVHISNSSEKEVSGIKDMLKKYNIYSIGRYGSWTYCSIEDNITEAKILAEELQK